MLYLQVLINGILLGGLYSCIAVGFSLVWGVLNIINILHGSLIILGAYAAYFAFTVLGIHPFLFVPVAGLALFVLGYSLQAGVINRVMGAPVLITLTLTFGLNLVLENAMILAFKADYRKVILDPPLGLLEMGSVDRAQGPALRDAARNAAGRRALLRCSARPASAARSWRCGWTATPPRSWA